MSTSEQRQKDEVLAAVNKLEDANFKAHLLAAIATFERNTTNSALQAASNHDDDASDPVVKAIKESNIKPNQARDSLFIAIHLLIKERVLELKCTNGANVLDLPENWDCHSSNGLFQIGYGSTTSPDLKYHMQGLFVGDKFELYLSDSKNCVHSLEINVNDYIRSSDTEIPLQNIASLRAKITCFLENIIPKKKITNEPCRERIPPYPMHFPDRPNYPHFPSVGAGDLFPPGFPDEDSGMLVGPGHSLFGRRQDPTRGPVPGARFDPFGPLDDPTNTTGRFSNPYYPSAPRVPFGAPNPDHLRMPRDDESYSFHSSHSNTPFGADNAYF